MRPARLWSRMLGSILKAKKVVLAGDHFQLSPTIKSDQAARNGLNNTLLEKCVKLWPQAVVLLEEQYRMNERIMGYSSKVFYEDKLKAHGSVAQHVLYTGATPMAFIDTAGCGSMSSKTAQAPPIRKRPLFY